eukprot:TRINITY_DN15292_c0_g1_i1.p1 TRINITY_DN15292_c0_g1~~TRINITY_DN15292_c0_g1_i1.p1  ORF type:complete len:338 (-),score=63.80 TRINITY_DN15292_c0_g1_i1:91-1104(-)
MDVASSDGNNSMESKRPSNSAFKQQRLKAWQPILTPKAVILSFVLIGLIFIPVGVVLLVASDSVVEIESQPYDQCPSGYSSDGSPVCEPSGSTTDCPCVYHDFLDLDMKAPVYMYYKMENFYQNHRRYVKSRSDSQLAGDLDVTSASLSNCDPYKSYNNSDEPEDVFLPCGLIARSVFTDTFRLVKLASNETGGVEVPVPWTMDGIAWQSDIDSKFNNPPLNATGIRTIPDFKHPDFVVWMRTAGLPTFRKLYRIINQDLVGDYRVYIHNTYDVTAFDGHKYIVLSTTSWLGGKNPFLGYAYIIVGSVCIALALIFGLKQAISPRATGDTTYLEWAH